MDEITIHIFLNSDGDEYQYEIYKGSPNDVRHPTYLGLGESIDGGACITTMQNAIEMAAEQAKKLVE